jgi:hypothetical protein
VRPPSARLGLEPLNADARGQPAAPGLAGRYGDLLIAGDDGVLHLLQGRRPPRTLVPLESGRFSLLEEPGVRFEIERRPGTGEVSALVRTLPGGGEIRLPRTSEIAAALPRATASR